jgi:hypothetical protein
VIKGGRKNGWLVREDSGGTGVGGEQMLIFLTHKSRRLKAVIHNHV